MVIITAQQLVNLVQAHGEDGAARRLRHEARRLHRIAKVLERKEAQEALGMSLTAEQRQTLKDFIQNNLLADDYQDPASPL